MKPKFRNVNNNLLSSDNVFIHLPSKADMTWDRYVAPFSYGLWLAVAIAACAISVCLALRNYGKERDQRLTVPAIIFYVFGCLFQQGETSNSYVSPVLLSWIFALINIFPSSLPLVFFASFYKPPF
jgi:hypothetical protein